MLTVVATILSAVLAVFSAAPTSMHGTLSSAMQPPLPPRIVPGDSVLGRSWRTADSVRYALTMFRDADEIPVGQLVDTTVTDQRTLAPRTRRSLQQNRRVLLEFNGARVKGSLAPLDAPPVPLDTTLRVAPFDAGNWELLLRALPLEKDFAARFPVYDLDGGLREYRVNVTGRTPVQGEDCDVVILTLARNRESVVWVSVATGQVVQIETMLGETTLLRQVRVLR